MAQNLPSLSSESALWAQIERSRVARQNALATISPRTVQGITAMHRAYPHMPADAKMALARSGRSPTDPVSGVVAAASVKRRAKKGFGWHSVGDFINAGVDIPRGAIGALGEFVSPAAEAVTGVVRPAIRGGFMALQAPFEEAYGLARNVASGLPGKLGEMTAGAGGGAAAGAAIGSFIPIPGVGTGIGAAVGAGIGALAGALGPDVEGRPEWAPSSQLGIAAGQLLKGEEVEAGSGFFVGHKTKLFEEQRARAIRQAKIKGTDTAWTIGRSVSDVVLEPGTTPYNVISGLIDGATMIKADPAALALAKRSRIVAARKTLDPTKAAEFKLTDAYRTLREGIAAQPSAHGLRRMFNGQLDNRPDILDALAKTDDADEVGRILDAPDLLGGSVFTLPTAAVRKKVTTRLSMSDAGLTRRQLVNVPREALDWSEPAGAMDKLDAWMAIGRVPAAIRLAINDRFIAALATGSPAQRLEPLEAAAQAVEEVVKGRLGAHKAQALIDKAQAGLTPLTAAELSAAENTVKAATEIGRQVTKLFTKTHADARHYSGMAVAEGVSIPGVQVAGDRMSLVSPHLPSEFLTHKTFLPDSDDIARFTGFAARAYKHPLVPNSVNALDRAMGVWRRTVVLRPAYIPRTIGEAQARMAASGYDSLFRHPIDFIARIVAQKKGQPLALTGEPLADMDVIQGGLNRMSGTGALADQSVALSDRARLTITDGADEFYAGWQNHELAHVATDPMARTIMREVMRVPAGEAVVPRTIDDIKASFWDGPLQGIRKDLSRYVDDELHLADRASADSYVDSIVERIEHFTRGDTDILDYAIAYGRDAGADPKAARAAMERLAAEGNAPKMVVGRRFGGRLSPEKQGLFDQVTNVAFDHIAVRPENFFVRHPIMSQAYWNSSERMLPAMDDAGKAYTLQLARDSDLPASQIARLEARAEIPNPGGVLAREDVHQIAAFEAVDEVKGLLYDYSQKKQWAAATRLIFPFADVWQEMLTTWSKLVVQNPAALRRGQQVVEGARGSGFFSTDENGEETFTYPGSAFISKHLVGAPIPFKASAGGLNLFASNPVMPGFGPLAQWGAGMFLPDKPEFDWAQEIISPFGDITEKGAISAVLPPWARRLKSFMTSGESDRLFNNTVGDMAAYLVTAKGYSISTPEEQEQTTEAAVSMAKRMYLLRAFAQSSLPSAPQPVPVADVDGRIVTQQKLVDEFRALQKDPEEGGVGYEAAPAEFLSRYGEEALLFMQPKSRGGAPPLEDTMDWVRSHPDLVKRYKTTYGYFAPHAGEFSMTAYERQIATGERDALTPIERYQLANSRVAQMRLRQVKDQIGPKPSKAQRAWLTRFSEALADTYQGYEPQAFDPARTPRMVRELERAAANPTMAQTPTGKAIAKYFEARKRAIEISRTRLDLTSAVPYAKAKKAAPVREWLRQVATAIISETPDFAAVWDQVLSHELTTDDLEEQVPPPEVVV